MYAVEFEAPIENGIVRIPQQYQELQQNPKARFVVIYTTNSAKKSINKDNKVKNRLDEFHRLIAKSNNKVMLTHEMAINTDEMIEDGLLWYKCIDLYFCSRHRSQKQRGISIKLLDNAIRDDNLILSEISLYEFAFSCKKLEEDSKNIQDNLKFLSQFVKPTDIDIHKRVLEIFENTDLYHSSFDIFHLAFAEYYNGDLITLIRF